MAKIKYNKEKPGRILTGRSPRDLQLRQKVLLSQNATQVDFSQYLPLDEVRKKIEEAVNATREEEHKRWKTSLENLTNQLSAIRKERTLVKSQLADANREINCLKDTIKLLERNLQEKNIQLDEKEREVLELNKEISRLKRELDNKTIEITKLQASFNDIKSTELIVELQNKLDKLYEKIQDGSISSFVGKEISKPELENKIFIDPLDNTIKEKEDSLDTYINVKTEHKEVKRSVKEDVSKLKKILKKQCGD